MATATASDVIVSAARRVGILAAQEALDAAEGVDMLQMMNRLMSGFGPMGIQYIHVDLALSTTVNMPDELIRPLILMVASEFADEFFMTLSPKLMADIDRAKSTLQAAYFMPRPGIVDPLLRSGIIGRFNITTGE